VHRHLPPRLEKAFKLQNKAAKVGFDWKNSTIYGEAREEWTEMEHAAQLRKRGCRRGDALEEEFGDLSSP
jgi:uncharacterized protein YabN with tetrapyrrole methylase and pyrophosphatase domain